MFRGLASGRYASGDYCKSVKRKRAPRSATAVLPQPEVLSSSTDHRTRHKAARRPDCPPHVLSQLAADGELAVQLVAASREDTPPDALRQLADSPSRVVRRAAESSLARASGLTPPDIETGFDYSADERAANPNTPVEQLLALAENDHWGICHSLVHNPACPPEALMRLAGSSALDRPGRGCRMPGNPASGIATAHTRHPPNCAPRSGRLHSGPRRLQTVRPTRRLRLGRPDA